MTPLPQYNSSKNDHPFGMIMPGRSYSSTAYKYGFNGKEKDDEVKGVGNSLAFEARVFDSRLGRWLSRDPRESEYAWQSTYAYYCNNPINIIDFLGEGETPTKSEIVEFAADRYLKATKNLEKIINDLTYLQGVLENNNDVLNAHLAVDISNSGLPKGYGAVSAFVMFVHRLVSGVDAKFEEQCSLYENLSYKLESALVEYNRAKNEFKGLLKVTSKISVGGIILDKLDEPLHKNNKNSNGSFALYEFEIEGQHYKYGLANVDTKTKTDIKVQTPNGEYKTIPRGTPIRVYQQQREMLTLHDDVRVKIEIFENVYKYQMLQIETERILEKAKANGGIVGDGNTFHAKKYSFKQLGKFLKKY